MCNQRGTRSVAAAEGTTEFPSMHQLCTEVARLGQLPNADDVLLRALDRFPTGLGTTVAGLFPLSDAVAQLTSRDTITAGLPSHVANQTERMESALKHITDLQDTERLIINVGSLTHREAIHGLLI